MQISNLEEVEKVLEQADLRTLVIFDVDDVLITPIDEFAIREPIRKELTKDIKEKYSKEKYEKIFSNFFQSRIVRLVNPKIIELLEKLKKKNIPTTALTAWWTGKFGNIPQMEDLRFKTLDQVDISFKSISPFKEDWTFPELKSEGRIPILKNGIIITGCVDKGIVLKAVLKKANFQFDKIIFIDDHLSFLKSVEEASEELNIKFVGIHYIEASLIPLPKLDTSKEKLRFEILEKEHIWLLDKELNERFEH